MKTKIQEVKDHLKRYGSITSWDAITMYRATRLSAIIFNLRADDWNIESVYITIGTTTFVRYYLRD